MAKICIPAQEDKAYFHLCNRFCSLQTWPSSPAMAYLIVVKSQWPKGQHWLYYFYFLPEFFQHATALHSSATPLSHAGMVIKCLGNKTGAFTYMYLFFLLCDMLS